KLFSFIKKCYKIGMNKINIILRGNMDNKDISVKRILEICNGKLICGNEDVIVKSYSKDTRTINDGDMYLGIKGETVNGNNFIEQAFKNGAIGCITDEKVSQEILNKYKEKIIVEVDNTVKAIQELAKYKRSLYNIPVIAITGSVRKN
ncbi:MAG: Mur ligase domain-containing protein, partial [Clostridia bacterium]|nr:Mur ligase domain-containing protein [Clostridia bacterium]